MATKFLEPGGDADFGIGLWTVDSGTPAIATDFVHGGHIKSIKYRPGATVDQVKNIGIITDAGGRASLYIYLNVLPTSNLSAPVLCNNSADSSVLTINITSGGVLQIVNNVGTQIGLNGATLSTGVWYRLCLAWKITSSTVNEIRLFKDGTSTISITNGTLDATGMDRFYIGNATGDATFDMRSSDHYLDDSNALTDPGNIWVTAKRPNANGTTNGFTTQIGAGGSGYGTGHSPQVNERALSTTNGWSMVGAGAAVTEEYSIENAATGDISLTGATIVDFMGWVYAKSLAGETASIIVAGSSSSISLTSSNTMFTKIAGSTTYPAGNTDIGVITTTALTTVSLYECGVIVAYIPASSSPAISLTDNFDDNSLDGAKWVTNIISSATVNETNKRIEITPAVSTANSEGDLLSAPIYTAKYDLTNSFYVVNLKQALNANANCYVLFRCFVDDNNIVDFHINGSPRLIYASSMIAGSYTDDVNTAHATYSSITHAWLRIRHGSGNIYWEYSLDGLSWTELTHITAPFSITLTYPKMVALTNASVGSPGAAWFDNFNLPLFFIPSLSMNQPFIGNDIQIV